MAGGSEEWRRTEEGRPRMVGYPSEAVVDQFRASKFCKLFSIDNGLPCSAGRDTLWIFSASRSLSSSSAFTTSWAVPGSMVHLLFGMMVLVPWTQVAGALCDIRRKGHLAGNQVTFFDAYGVSCRARVEEADPTAMRRLAPFVGSPAAGRD